MSYSLSAVLLIPAAHKDSINALAEQMGWGPNNLSIPLNNGAWYGCHTWAAPAFMDEFSLAPPAFAETLAALVVSTQEGGSPAEHWTQVLEANSLIADMANEASI